MPGSAPTERSAREIRQITNRERLQMAAVAPIGVEITERAVLAAGISGLAEVSEGGVMATEQSHPGGRSGADVEGNFCAREGGGFRVKRMANFVAPIQRHGIL